MATMAPPAPPVVRIDPKPPVFGTLAEELTLLSRIFGSTALHVFDRNCKPSWTKEDIPKNKQVFANACVTIHDAYGNLLFTTNPWPDEEIGAYKMNDYLAGHFHAALDWLNDERLRKLDLRLEEARRAAESAEAVRAPAS